MVTLEKPTSVDGDVIVGTGIGVTGGTDNFVIKTTYYSFDLWSPLAETTGDGDTAPVWENNLLIYGRFIIRGAMIASVAFGLAKLIDTTVNPTLSLAWTMGGTREVNAQVIVERIRPEWRRTGQFVLMTMTGRSSVVHPTEDSV
jgi:hypothetical protein